MFIVKGLKSIDDYDGNPIFFLQRNRLMNKDLTAYLQAMNIANPMAALTADDLETFPEVCVGFMG